MKTKHKPILFLGLIILIALFNACKDDDDDDGCSEYFGCESYDIEANGIPKFISADYIELDKIQRISKFRSGVGHDFSDDFESCRSMKHYYKPYDTIDWTSVKIYSPVNGEVIFLEQEWTGSHLQIKCTDFPAFYVELFHVNLAHSLSVGDAVHSNEYLGNHSSGGTTSDISIAVSTPSDGPNSTWLDGLRLISYFDVISDSIFQRYQARGVVSRDSCIITRLARDLDPLDCNVDWNSYPGGTGNIPNWITLD